MILFSVSAPCVQLSSCCFFYTATASTEIYTLSLHDALPICSRRARGEASRSRSAARARGARPPPPRPGRTASPRSGTSRSEEHTSELQSLRHLVCRLLLEKKKTTT